VSKKDREPIEGAVVSAVERGGQSAQSDAEGYFRLDLAPGKYTLRITGDMHKPVRARNVKIIQARIQTLNVDLEVDENAVEDAVVVEAEVERASASTQLMLRRNSAASADAMGAQEIAKSPDRNAADAMRRVVGASVEGGRYLLVRGLGDRYMLALLNGSPIPSPEPDRQLVPLDMFPSLVLSDLTVRKTSTPDVPGDFTGGLLDLHTRDVPDRFTFIGNLALGLNTMSTFAQRRTYAGGGLDFLGVDDGTRKLPKIIPAERVGRLLPDKTLNPRLTEYGQALSSRMDSERTFTLPNGSGAFVLGNGHKLGSESSVGYLVSAGYSRRFQIKSDEVIQTFSVDTDKPGALRKLNEYRGDTGIDTVTWSTLAEAGLKLGSKHNIYFTGLYSRNASKEARSIEGFNESQNATIRDERLRFENRGLAYGQLRGDHRFDALGVQVNWRALWARATLSDPDLRQTVYQLDPETGFSFRDGSQSGMHFFGSQSETTRSVGLDLTKSLNRDPERQKSLKFGALANLKGRSFDVRRFRYQRNNSGDSTVFRKPPQELFRNENIGPALELEEWTRPTDSYVARYNVFAAYALADLQVHPRVRFVFGERIETSKQTLESFDPFAAGAQEASTNLNRLDLLPSGTAVVKITDKTYLRGSVTRSVARPQLRELAPFVFTEFSGAFETLGNPKLDRTTITNYDLRAEWFPSPTEVIAASFFAKQFQKPIESTVIPTSNGSYSFQNADGASNVGVELELRKQLVFLHPALSEFALFGNATFLYSRVQLSRETAGLLTNTERALAGQSPFVFNLALDYEHGQTKTRGRILYNVAGPRISRVGVSGLPDMYEQPRHILDISVAQGLGERLDLKLSLENLLDAPVRFTQGNATDAPYTNRFQLGRSAWLTLTYTQP
jgi:TonB dependent receptor/Carboxypeptidase regulatory-like domain/TonB-dependent Receptor Plug Domain